MESVHGFETIGSGGDVSFGEKSINRGLWMVVYVIEVLEFLGFGGASMCG